MPSVLSPTQNGLEVQLKLRSGVPRSVATLTFLLLRFRLLQQHPGT